ncbi:MAG: chorismate mutase [Candidatus Hodarchaeales archaeon]|jgi:chorismate mutase
MELDELRSHLSDIDQQIIELISQRISLVPDITRYKKEHNISIFQPEREKQMHSKYWKLAVEKRINPEIIRQVFEIIIEETRNLQFRGNEV